jgi:DNA mismatch repair protein MutL
MTIQMLPDEVASQIAAGEVVERPASVIKELIENSIDAGATVIRIRSEGAGQKLLEVQDNGVGIPASEISLAVTRHATSKLRTADDLFRVNTLGFRGEALASIGSVSLLTLTSRTSDDPLGAEFQVEGGKPSHLTRIGGPVGTTIRVENLFFNVPARKKFLKTDLTERRQIDEVATRYALAFPHIRFTLIQEGKSSLQTTGNGDRREIISILFGVDIARQMLTVLADEGDIRISGLISPVSLTRANRRAIQFFVNGRPVQDFTLTTALLQGYHTLLMVGRYPIAQLFLEMFPEDVDVNVHPTKAEVRFHNRDHVFGAIQRSTRRALLAYTPVPELRQQYDWQESTSSSQDPSFWRQWESVDNEGQVGSLTPTKESDRESDPILPQMKMPLLRLIGQVATAYLIAEGPDGLYLIDQHAAHERVLFEKFLAQQSGSVPSQSLLEPVQVELPPSSARLLEDQLETLNRLGFRVEIFGKNVFLVRSIPALLAGMDASAALRVLVEDFEEDETPLKDRIEARIIARVCKRAAVKAGHSLSEAEQRALLQDLELTESPRTCPHGRPTMIHLSVDLLERQFGRRGAR